MRKIFSLLIIATFMSGCAATVESRIDAIRGDYMNTSVDATDLENKNNLDLLITADALFHADDISAADSAYEIFNRKNPGVADGGDIMREAASFTLGPNVNDYKPYMMDSLFVSYYQLWAALADGRFDDARVIINQSYARQADMSRAYEKLIESNQKSIGESLELATDLQNENSKWTAYRDIMNPALMYLSGIYFLNNGDFGDAKTYLARANGMVPENSFIVKDLKNAEFGTTPKNTIWVFIEDGFAPKLTERRISLPIIHGDGITTVTVATSEPVFSNNYVHIDGAQDLADVDAMFMTEYGEYRINDALRAFASASARVALQTTMYNSRSNKAPLLGLLSTLYSEFTNSADVRTWATLPKTISVLRMPNNKSGLIELSSNGNVIEKVSVPTYGNYLIYVRTAPTGYDIKTIKLK
ncbi:MAG: hypothetical protein J5620_03335 [Alphaproteobacteria bacterium]|nr:hypothetical protein [Alphaproteobacteria bacterium]